MLPYLHSGRASGVEELAKAMGRNGRTVANCVVATTLAVGDM
jgi:hypothetical protein